MNFIVLQLCCFDCMKLIHIYFVDFHFDDYIDFITGIENYEDYDFIVYDSLGCILWRGNGEDL